MVDDEPDDNEGSFHLIYRIMCPWRVSRVFDRASFENHKQTVESNDIHADIVHHSEYDYVLFTGKMHVLDSAKLIKGINVRLKKDLPTLLDFEKAGMDYFGASLIANFCLTSQRSVYAVVNDDLLTIINSTNLRDVCADVGKKLKVFRSVDKAVESILREREGNKYLNPSS